MTRPVLTNTQGIHRRCVRASESTAAVSDDPADRPQTGQNLAPGRRGAPHCAQESVVPDDDEGGCDLYTACRLAVTGTHSQPLALTVSMMGSLISSTSNRYSYTFPA